MEAVTSRVRKVTEEGRVMRVIDKYPEINPFNDVGPSNRVIGWWSGGVASAVACKIVLEKYENVEIAFCDTSIEHPDTYELLHSFEKVMGVKINVITSSRMTEPEQVWRKYKGLNFAHGAPCSMVLKKEPRMKFQKTKTDFAQVFGFDYGKKEERRARNMLVNNPDINPIFPLIVEKLSREKIFKEFKSLGLKIPEPYKHFLNNNCIGAEDSPIGGCIQGGVGYWQKLKELYPLKFEYMANIEHEISSSKGSPVTICKDQRAATAGNKLFLRHNEEFPEIKTIDIIKGRRPITPFECNGFCSLEEQ